MTFLTELKAHLAGLVADFRRRHAYADQLQAEVAQAIAADAAAAATRASRLAYTAEQADLEASRLLRDSLADGRITAAEIPVLRTALNHITRSARHDHTITEVCRE